MQADLGVQAWAPTIAGCLFVACVAVLHRCCLAARVECPPALQRCPAGPICRPPPPVPCLRPLLQTEEEKKAEAEAAQKQKEMMELMRKAQEEAAAKAKAEAEGKPAEAEAAAEKSGEEGSAAAKEEEQDTSAAEAEVKELLAEATAAADKEDAAAAAAAAEADGGKVKSLEKAETAAAVRATGEAVSEGGPLMKSQKDITLADDLDIRDRCASFLPAPCARFPRLQPCPVPQPHRLQQPARHLAVLVSRWQPPECLCAPSLLPPGAAPTSTATSCCTA